MVIYEELESVWRREFHGPDLQPLRQGFFKDLSSYVKRLREAQQNLDAKSLKALLLEDELRRLEELLSQLLDSRLNKLMSDRETAQSTDLDSVERQANQALSSLRRDYERARQDIMHGREPTTKPSKRGGFVLVRFEKDVPSIMGVDLKVRGPFKREDVATLPQENAESLMRQGTAMEIAAHGQDNE